MRFWVRGDDAQPEGLESQAFGELARRYWLNGKQDCARPPVHRRAVTSHPADTGAKMYARGNYRMFFSWYRWSFGVFALLTSTLCFLHMASARP